MISGLIRWLLRLGPNEVASWRAFAQEVGGTYVPPTLWRVNQVRMQVGHWTATLDLKTYSFPSGAETLTRLQVLYVAQRHFTVEIQRSAALLQIAKLFGMREVEIGDPIFDQIFTIWGSDVDGVRRFFDNARIRDYLRSEPSAHLALLKHSEPFHPAQPPGAYRLLCDLHGAVAEGDRLHRLRAFAVDVMEELHRMGIAGEGEPKTA